MDISREINKENMNNSLESSLELLESTLQQVKGDVALRTLDPNLDKFVNDEDRIKAEEIEEESTLLIEKETPSGFVPDEGDPKEVVAIDGSSIILGESSNGLLFSIRVAAVKWDPFSQKSTLLKRFECPCFVTKENKDFIYNELRKTLWGLTNKVSAPEPMKMADRVRNIYERYTQIEVSKSLEDSILLIDGSLTGGTIDTPTEVLRRIITNAIQNKTHLISFSKKTRLLTKDGTKLMDLSLLYDPSFPLFLPVKEIIISSHELLGDVYMGKLSRLPLSFRIDVASYTDSRKALADLMQSIYLESGYPKLLIDAHVNCYYNPFDAFSLQVFLAKKGITMRQEFDIRRLLFGVYGGA